MFAKEQALSLGRYPALSLKEARAAVAISVGAANTFSAIADELIAKRAKEGLKEITNGNARSPVSEHNSPHLTPFFYSWLSLDLFPQAFV
jgi:hypothetical protein